MCRVGGVRGRLVGARLHQRQAHYEFPAPEVRQAIAEQWAAQAAADAAAAAEEAQVPPPPPPPLFVQADPLTPPSLASQSGDAYPAQAAPIEMEEVVVIS